MFYIYTHITTGSDRGYVTLTCGSSEVNRGHLNSWMDKPYQQHLGMHFFFAFTFTWQMQANIACLRLTQEVCKGHRMLNLDHRRSNLDHRRSTHDSNTQGCYFCHVYSCDFNIDTCFMSVTNEVIIGNWKSKQRGRWR